jgi:hypothetical protein
VIFLVWLFASDRVALSSFFFMAEIRRDRGVFRDRWKNSYGNITGVSPYLAEVRACDGQQNQEHAAGQT